MTVSNQDGNSVLEIVEGSHVFKRESNGTEVYLEWNGMSDALKQHYVGIADQMAFLLF
jgi:hypothetical protein